MGGGREEGESVKRSGREEGDKFRTGQAGADDQPAFGPKSPARLRPHAVSVLALQKLVRYCQVLMYDWSRNICPCLF